MSRFLLIYVMIFIGSSAGFFVDRDKQCGFVNISKFFKYILFLFFCTNKSGKIQIYAIVSRVFLQGITIIFIFLFLKIKDQNYKVLMDNYYIAMILIPFGIVFFGNLVSKAIYQARRKR